MNTAQGVASRGSQVKYDFAASAPPQQGVDGTHLLAGQVDSGSVTRGILELGNRLLVSCLTAQLASQLGNLSYSADLW